MKSSRKTVRGGVRPSAPILAALIAVATLVAGAFYLPRAAEQVGLDARSFPSPATPSKDYWIGQMGMLQEEIVSLRDQLSADPGNAPLQAQLDARLAEFEAISQLLGGDVPPAAPAVDVATFGDKEQVHVSLRNMEEQITNLRQQLEEDPEDPLLLDQLDQALADFENLSAELGGDKPSPLGDGSVSFVPAPTPTGCAVTTSNFTNTIPTPIPATGTPVVVSTITVLGAGPYLWDLDLSTFITHTFSSDLDITLTSPLGTVVTITTDNAGGSDNVYNGTLWDDQADPDGQVPYASNPGLGTDHPYVNLVVATPLVVEEALGAFIGQDPNGVWTLTVNDDANLDGGSLDSWSLSVSTLAAAPTESTLNFADATVVPISATGTPLVSSTIVVAGAGATLTNLRLTTNIAHTFSSDLDVTVQSPTGKVVTLTTDNGGGSDNVFAGTLWDDDGGTANAPGPASDNVYVNLVPETPLVPEEALAAFNGDDPNGTWTLTISDDANLDGGSLNGWSLEVTTGECAAATGPCVCTPVTFTNSTPAPISATGTPLVISTITVLGADPYLYNLDLTSFITHSFNSDLDITLTSPANTHVTITTDNAGGNDNVYNGTLWDDDADPDGLVPYASNPGLATDQPYVNLVVATPLVIEEALGAFIGESPNGTWTLTISDDANLDGGSLNSWSLSVCSLASPPIETTASFSNLTAVPIPAAGTPLVASIIPVLVPGTQLGRLRATTNISHTFSTDLDVTLSSPGGTIVTLTTDNAGGNDNVFAGTLWDDKADPDGLVPYATNAGLATDHPYVNLVVATPLVAEEALAAFNDENPNGNWTLTISDDANLDGGSLNSWSVEVTTIECQVTGGCTPGSCDDQNACTDNVCNTATGQCEFPPIVCPDDNNVCTTDSCDPATGCVYAPNTGSCSDGNACTTNDTCAGGSCVGGPAPNCDDLNICTTDSCAPATGCVNTPNTARCNDGNACTEDDACAQGQCVGGPPPNCDDLNVCTDDSCDPGTGCVNTPNTAPCDDANACTTADTCAAGSCVGGPPPNCDDLDPCTVDTCDPAIGCVNTPVAPGADGDDEEDDDGDGDDEEDDDGDGDDEEDDDGDGDDEEDDDGDGDDEEGDDEDDCDDSDAGSDDEEDDGDNDSDGDDDSDNESDASSDDDSDRGQGGHLQWNLQPATQPGGAVQQLSLGGSNDTLNDNNATDGGRRAKRPISRR